MKFNLEQAKYILETLSNTASQDIDGDEFEVEWGNDSGNEGFASHSISDTAGIALEHINSIEMVNRELLAALEAAVECNMVPISSAREGGAAKHSIQVKVADQIRAAIYKAKGIDRE